MNLYTRDLIVVPEGIDEETGEPTTWAMITGRTYKEGDEVGKPSKVHYIWIDKQDEKEYIITTSNGLNLTGKVYKTLQGAKRGAEQIAYRQEESGFFTN